MYGALHIVFDSQLDDITGVLIQSNDLKTRRPKPQSFCFTHCYNSCCKMNHWDLHYFQLLLAVCQSLIIPKNVDKGYRIVLRDGFGFRYSLLQI